MKESKKTYELIQKSIKHFQIYIELLQEIKTKDPDATFDFLIEELIEKSKKIIQEFEQKLEFYEAQ